VNRDGKARRGWPRRNGITKSGNRKQQKTATALTGFSAVSYNAAARDAASMIDEKEIHFPICVLESARLNHAASLRICMFYRGGSSVGPPASEGGGEGFPKDSDLRRARAVSAGD
jgi:hypothetical protein